MPARAPLDLLAEELGEALGRAERELALKFAVKEAELAARESALEAREAEREMRLVRMEQAASERLATLRDGRDGEPGPAGPQGTPGEPGAEGGAGRDGIDGRSWIARGSYEPGADYGNGDVVWRDMSPFIALRDEPGPCEEGNANWQLVIPRASRGQQGKAGDRGPSGAAGAAAPRPVGLNALPDYQAQLVLDDGTMGEPFSVRTWFEQYDSEARR